jgi:hypothetical protein
MKTSQYKVVIERMSDSRRFQKCLDGQGPNTVIKLAYAMLAQEAGDYYVVSATKID